MPALRPSRTVWTGVACLSTAVILAFGARAGESGHDAPSPDGQAEAALWSLDDAWRQKNALRERVCLNGLWRFKPVRGEARPDRVPAAGTGWGFFKVPGIWPGKHGWLAPGDAQTIHHAPATDAVDEAGLNTAWYRRAFVVPPEWRNRKVELEVTMLQTAAVVYLDGIRVGELHYPGGLLELAPGPLGWVPDRAYELALLVSARPDAGTGKAFMAPDRLVDVPASPNCRGVTGDAYLLSRSSGARLTDVRVATSVKSRTIALDVGLENLSPGQYRLEATIREGEAADGPAVKSFRSEAFDLSVPSASERRTFTSRWLDPKLWDLDAPENLYTVEIRLMDGGGNVADALFPETFGFREFWIDGRDFRLNGTVVHLRSLVNNGTCMGADMAFADRMETMAARLKAHGFNHMIAHNYDFAPGTVGYQDAFYQVMSRRGILTSLTLPHLKDFNWSFEDPAQLERYRRYAESMVRRFQNLPGVVLYAMNHNATGYYGDQNPEKIDGIHTPDTQEDPVWPERSKRRREAGKAAALVKTLDPTRPVYHHESGNLGDVYTLNCYLNWAPRQERDDWLEHWEAHGKRPLMFVEWGMPHLASWSSYRGPQFIWGTQPVVQWLWLNEFNAALLGEDAYRLDPGKIASARRERELTTGNQPSHFHQLSRFDVPDVDRVRAWMTGSNLRHLRARGLSGFLPWDQTALWKRNPKAQPAPYPLAPHADLKRPGIVPDRVDPGSQYIEAFDDALFDVSETGRGVLPSMRELVGWIGGKPGDFSEKSRVFTPGETVEKQLVLLNDSRRPRTATCTWNSHALKANGKVEAEIPPGGRVDLPIRFTIPAGYLGNAVDLEVVFEFATGDARTEHMSLKVIPPAGPRPAGTVGLYDPKGLSLPILSRLGIACRTVAGQADLEGLDILVVGREGLDRSPLLLGELVRRGLKVLVLEQNYDTLTRLGFRANIHGLREAFPTGDTLGSEPFRDWRGRSTLVPPRLRDLPEPETSDPTWNWNGFENTRVWRAGNRGTVATVLLEKPSVGAFRPLASGGFDLQYAPALEWTDGAGTVVFSQFDLSGRTESDPEADDVFRRLLLRLDAARSEPVVATAYLGDGRGRALLRRFGIRATDTFGGDTGLLVLGPGARPAEGVAPDAAALNRRVANGLSVMTLGLSRAELETWFPGRFAAAPGVHFADFVERPGDTPEFAGLTNADLHWRGEARFDAFPPDAPGGRSLGIVRIGRGRVVALQVAPWFFDKDELSFRTTIRRNQFLVSRLLHNLKAMPEPVIFDWLDAGAVNGGVLALADGWIGKADPRNLGRREGYAHPDFMPERTWRPVKVPGHFERQFNDLKDYDGLFWYRKRFDLAGPPARSLVHTLHIGPVDDESWIWLNGEFLGPITAQTHPGTHWSVDRTYEIRSELLRRENNVLVVLCNDLRMGGGIMGKPSLRFAAGRRLYADSPMAVDDPYRYYRW